MRKYLSVVLAVVALTLVVTRRAGVPVAPETSGPGAAVLAEAFRARLSEVPVAGEGIVARVLPDDNDGSRHQRFILRLATGQTVLVSHNLDIAPRLTALQPGDTVSFKGVYEWNASGGVVHWTHHDPAGRHPAGWLEHGGQRVR